MRLAHAPTSSVVKYDELPAEPPRHKFTPEQYHRMAEEGFFRESRVELFEGVVLQMAPQKDTHVAGTLLAQQALMKAFPQHLVRTQLPLSIGDSEPEPDVSVVVGGVRDYVGTGHPKSAVLVLEVSDSTLGYDRVAKASLYAKAGILDYWVVNLAESAVEVRRDPVTDASAPLGFRYQKVMTLKVPESVSPLGNPAISILVADLLP